MSENEKQIIKANYYFYYSKKYSSFIILKIILKSESNYLDPFATTSILFANFQQPF